MKEIVLSDVAYTQEKAEILVLELLSISGVTNIRRQLVGEWLRKPYYPGKNLDYRLPEIMTAYRDLAEEFIKRNPVNPF